MAKAMEEYYQKVIQLQEKLRQSEEERLKLEMKFNDMLQMVKDEEEAHLKKLRYKYKQFLEEDIQRQLRNNKILETLDRIENRAAMWEAKAQRYKTVRRQYQSYLNKSNSFVDDFRQQSSQEVPPEQILRYTRKDLPNFEQNLHKHDESILHTYSNLGNVNSVYWKRSKEDEKINLEKVKELEDLKLTTIKITKDMENSKKQSNNTVPNNNYFTKLQHEIMETPEEIHSNLELLLKQHKQQPRIDTSSIANIKDIQEASSSKKVNPLDTEKNDISRELDEKPQSFYEQTLKDKEDSQYLTTDKDQHLEGSDTNTEEKFELDDKTTEKYKCVLQSNEDFRPHSSPKLKGEPSEFQCNETTQPTQHDMKNPIEQNESHCDTNIGQTLQDQVDNEKLLQHHDDGRENQLRDNNNQKLSQNDEEQLHQQNESNKQSIQQCKDKEQPLQNYNETPQSNQQYTENVQYNDNTFSTQNCNDQQLFQQYDESGQIVQQYDENGQPLQQYDENGQPLHQYIDGQVYQQYDENRQPLQQYNENGQPLRQYDEIGQSLQQYPEEGQSYVQCDENEQPLQKYSKDGQPYAQYDEIEQPLQQYDENGQPLQQYDENGQNLQYPEGGQSYPQYDENRQSMQYNQNEQGMEQYAENGQIFQQYDQNGQNVQQYNGNESEQYYNENSQPVQNYDQNETQQNQKEEQNEQKKEQDKTQVKSKVFDLLDTDTESIKQEAKISSESDFDFSNN